MLAANFLIMLNVCSYSPRARAPSAWWETSRMQNASRPGSAASNHWPTGSPSRAVAEGRIPGPLEPLHQSPVIGGNRDRTGGPHRNLPFRLGATANHPDHHRDQQPALSWTSSALEPPASHAFACKMLAGDRLRPAPDMRISEASGSLIQLEHPFNLEISHCKDG